MEFSKQHVWQGDPAVQQILVFACHETKEIFEREMADRIGKVTEVYTDRNGNDKYLQDAINRVSDSNAGAIFKLRGVLNHSLKWIAVIRCGITGCEVWESKLLYDTARGALVACLNRLSDMTHTTCHNQKQQVGGVNS